MASIPMGGGALTLSEIIWEPNKPLVWFGQRFPKMLCFNRDQGSCWQSQEVPSPKTHSGLVNVGDRGRSHGAGSFDSWPMDLSADTIPTKMLLGEARLAGPKQGKVSKDSCP